jgi:excisionase family DNA binding protein
MSNFLTTRQLQAMLQVDRTTIYRMADAGRIPALKVGSQWRFPRQQVESWLQSQDAPVSAAPAPPTPAWDVHALRQLIPLDCIQPMQDLFAETLGVMVIVTDLTGDPITRPSNPCGLYSVAAASPHFQKLCAAHWAQLAQTPGLHPHFAGTPLGLLCARGLIRVGAELGAMLVAGGIAPATWPPSEAQLAQIAATLEIDHAHLRGHLHEVFVLNAPQRDQVLGFVQRMADVIAHIVYERQTLVAKLHNIAELSKV